ncbi:alpha/beta hydrolase [Bacillus cereus]|uniref:Alpha/beta fold hydrolase n=1 Tax=Bacillus cereus TaxID=1396 RepID=A0A9X8NTP3_BACCE|nr:alpha/beta fold hydrolase [Bacillus cereus]RWQ71107.1 alpha/beta fold hydrolase [Bacillus cereus]
MKQTEIILPHYNKNEWLAASFTIPTNIHAILIVCHGLTGNKTGPQMFQKSLAKWLAEEQILVVRFDFRGSGDSSGIFYQTNFKEMITDTELVTNYIQKQYPNKKIFYSGLSIGAIVSTIVAIKKNAPGNIIISSDLAEGTFGTTTQTIRNGEFYLCKRFWEERSSINIRNMLKESSIKSKLFFGEKDSKVKKAAKDMNSILSSKSYKDMDHLFGDYKTRKKLAKDVAEFIKSCLEGL